ncbi:MAG: hypothetical protein WBB17_07745 [Saprospiraceae bacterium]
MKPRIRYCILTMYLTTQILSAQVDNTITRSGVKMTLKSKTSIGKNATLAKYCNSKSGKCEELLITTDKKSITMPLASGPVYNILRTGKTSSYKGLTKLISQNGKLTQYYTSVNNQLIVITPTGKFSHFVSLFNIGTRPLKISEITNLLKDTGYDELKDECKCAKKWTDCFLEPDPPGTTYEKMQENLRNCDKKYEECEEICRKIIMENVNTILVFRKTSAANDFQLTINN